LVSTYFVLILGMTIFATHKIKMLAIYLRRRPAKPALAAPNLDPYAPLVCVQCPVYNEPLVIDALLDSVTALRWPAGRLEIQLLDDSSDDTTARIEAWLARHPDRAALVRHIRRAKRSGYKAGALAHGMTLTRAEFFPIFDADFRPAPDFLETLMPHFDEPDVGVVQARWEFANRNASLLTRFQGLFLDAHFIVEQAARHAAGLFFNFNGTAGIWRRSALEQGGGWTSDTVTEDLDLSYRAQLRGWRFVYRGDYAVPSELPENMAAFKSQQHRWTKGGIQVMRKQLGTILRSDVPARIKREATWHLLVGFIHPLLIAFAALLVPYFLFVPAASGWLGVAQPVALTFTLWTTIGLYVAGRQLQGGAWREAAIIVIAAPLILSFGLAMSVTNTIAVIEGLCQRGGEFVRTPKGGARAVVGSIFTRLRGRALFVGATVIEVALGLVMLAGAIHFANLDRESVAILLGIKAAGFLGLAALSIHDLRPRSAP
jgi:cellulose synthase/poly-beta-1,6-N-acetylglucosamine synthase-like glycosyltransferase